eukprot:136720-Pelagomonas_calceolata.AAC.6
MPVAVLQSVPLVYSKHLLARGGRIGCCPAVVQECRAGGAYPNMADSSAEKNDRVPQNTMQNRTHPAPPQK